MRALPTLLAVAVVVASGCRCRNDGDEAAARPPTIYTDPADHDFSANPDLLERIAASPYGYFRFTNRELAQAVCRRFAGEIPSMPLVNLHGDAHIEQYAVTPDGRGLTDFDDSSTGPPVIDLVRFGVALHIAARERGWQDHADAFVDAFLGAYRDALANPDVTHEEPAAARRGRATFTDDRAWFLRRVDDLMVEVGDADRAGFLAQYQRYQALMREEHPELPDDFFDVVSFGRLLLGFGSALDEKYLIRVTGPSPAPDDDIVLEAKEVRDLSSVECVASRSGGGAFRILVGQARIAEVPHRWAAQVPRRREDDPGDPLLWIHAWHENYYELHVSALQSPEELAEVARDVGYQLGRGHPREIAAPLDSQLRRALLDTLDRAEEDIRATIDELTDAVIRGWKQFSEAAQQPR